MYGSFIFGLLWGQSLVKFFLELLAEISWEFPLMLQSLFYHFDGPFFFLHYELKVDYFFRQLFWSLACQICNPRLNSYVTIMCRNDELRRTMSSVGCFLKDSELFTLLAENSQILLKISVIHILLTFIYLVSSTSSVSKQPTQLIVQLNSSLWHIIVTLLYCKVCWTAE